jgi:chromosome segregation protein
MYLSKLELHGFKSFAERTVLHFDPGITAIVGPNGCGKSNIVDAVRWVIGEQRARILRSEKMENVIFNGTSKRRPLGMSEVLLTIENNRSVLPTEYSEVELGRRLFRSGDSEYLMNGVQCRLKDVTDLFMDTGMGAGAYSVIELKMVEEIISENAEDRRRLFEEAAGITKYKLRRRQTLTKLETTQADLIRLRDLTDEIGKQVRSLRRQAEKAERYRQTADRLHKMELALAHIEFSRLNEQKTHLEHEIESIKKELARLEAEEAREETKLDKLRTELVEMEAVLSQRQSEMNSHLEQVHTLETERRLADQQLENSRKELYRAQQEQQNAVQRTSELEMEVATLTSALEEAEPAHRTAFAKLEDIRKVRDEARAAAEERQQNLQDLRQKERLQESRRSELRRQLDRLINRRELIEEEIERTDARIRDIEASIDDLRTRVTEADDERGNAERAVTDSHAALEEASLEQAFRRQKLDEVLEQARNLERRRDALFAEAQLLESMLVSFEDLSGAVQYLASSDWTAGELRTVSDVFACGDEDRIALDAALGSYSGCLIVDSEMDALGAVEKLREAGQGRATFIVLERLKRAPSLKSHVEGVPRLIDVVRTAGPQYDQLAQLLLYQSYVVDTLEEARTASGSILEDARFYARTGEWEDARGILHGGSRQDGTSPSGSRLGRRERLDHVRSELEKTEGNLEQARALVEIRKSELSGVPHEQRRAELTAAERRLNDAEKTAARVSFELNSADGRLTELAEKITDGRESLRSLSEEILALEKAVRDADAGLQSVQSRVAEAQKAFEEGEAASRAAGVKFNEVNIAAIEARNQRDNLQRDRERSQSQLDDLARGFDTRRVRIHELDGSIGVAEQRLGAAAADWSRIRGDRKQIDEGLAYSEEAVRQTRDAIGNIENDLRTVRRQREHVLREENQRAVKVAEVQTRAEDLVEHIRQEFRAFLPNAIASGEIEIPEDFDERAARAEVAEMRTEVRSLGAVNELALETYEEEKERLDFLTKQRADLELAEEKLLETIREINITASRRFFETFEEIRINFQRLFVDLFGKEAAADLVLENPDDPLETAIEINARPRGKRPSTISQLSGGEKTLTAIALLFGIYLVKPSPFCILDEVDAPLDDANVERFMRLIREFSRETQFILVTHNKRTMEGADRLYGITMQEQGVSRLVGVRFDEAVEMVDRAA